MAFGMFSGYKGDYSDLRMIKLTIITNEIARDVCIFQKNIRYKNHVCPLKSGIFPSVYWFINLNLTDKHGTKHL